MATLISTIPGAAKISVVNLLPERLVKVERFGATPINARVGDLVRPMFVLCAQTPGLPRPCSPEKSS